MPLPSESEVLPVLLEVLAGLEGRARPADVYPRITGRFPLSPAELAELLPGGRNSAWQNRIQWTRQRGVRQGLIDPTVRGIWQLTEAGWAAVKSDRPIPDEQGNIPGDAPIELEPPDPIGPVDLISELKAAATDSANPNRLEETTARAFRALGFDAEVIGGPGNTDVVLMAPLGVHQYTVVVDAKSTARGRVADPQVDWLSIKQHRERGKADYACVVRPDFGGGNLIERATTFGVTLLTVGELCELLELHEEAPFALTELRPLFESAPFARTTLPRLRAVARDRRRLQLLVERVLALIDSFNRLQPDLVVAKAETLQALALTSLDEHLRGTTTEEVAKVLALLEAVGVLTPLPGGGYASTTSISGAIQRLKSLVPSGR